MRQTDNTSKQHIYRSPLLDIDYLDLVYDVLAVDSLHFVANVWHRLLFTIEDLNGLVSLGTVKRLCTYLPREIDQEDIARVASRESLTIYHYRFLNWYILLFASRRSESYEWILRFVVATYMMSSDIYSANIDKAQQLLQDFLCWFRNGTTEDGSPNTKDDKPPRWSTTCMVHNAIHLHEDYRRHGNLAVNSTYRYEKSFQTDKTVARTARGDPLSAIVAHYLKHEANPVIIPNYPFFLGKTLYMSGYSLSAEENDRWFLTRTYDVAFVIDFVGEIITAGKLEHVNNVHSEIAELVHCPTLPDLHWLRTANVNSYVLQDVSVHEVFCKLVAVPIYYDCFAFVPLLESLR